MSVSAKARTEQAAESLCDRIEERYLEARDRHEKLAQLGFFVALGVSVLTVVGMAIGGMPVMVAIPLLLLPWTLPWPLLAIAERRSMSDARAQVKRLIPETAKAHELSVVEVEQALNVAAEQRIKMLKALPVTELWARPLAVKLVRR